MRSSDFNQEEFPTDISSRVGDGSGLTATTYIEKYLHRISILHRYEVKLLKKRVEDLLNEKKLLQSEKNLCSTCRKTLEGSDAEKLHTEKDSVTSVTDVLSKTVSETAVECNLTKLSTAKNDQKDDANLRDEFSKRLRSPTREGNEIRKRSKCSQSPKHDFHVDEWGHLTRDCADDKDGVLLPDYESLDNDLPALDIYCEKGHHQAVVAGHHKNEEKKRSEVVVIPETLRFDRDVIEDLAEHGEIEGFSCIASEVMPDFSQKKDAATEKLDSHVVLANETSLDADETWIPAHLVARQVVANGNSQGSELELDLSKLTASNSFADGVYHEDDMIDDECKDEYRTNDHDDDDLDLPTENLEQLNAVCSEERMNEHCQAAGVSNSRKNVHVQLSNNPQSHTHNSPVFGTNEKDEDETLNGLMNENLPSEHDVIITNTVGHSPTLFDEVGQLKQSKKHLGNKYTKSSLLGHSSPDGKATDATALSPSLLQLSSGVSKVEDCDTNWKSKLRGAATKRPKRFSGKSKTGTRSKSLRERALGTSLTDEFKMSEGIQPPIVINQADTPPRRFPRDFKTETKLKQVLLTDMTDEKFKQTMKNRDVPVYSQEHRELRHALKISILSVENDAVDGKENGAGESFQKPLKPLRCRRPLSDHNECNNNHEVVAGAVDNDMSIHATKHTSTVEDRGNHFVVADDGSADVKPVTLKQVLNSQKRLKPPAEDLYDSFDCVPSPDVPDYKYVEVVRKKDQRRQLVAYDCPQCKKYYDAMDLTEEQKRERMNACGRHRAHYAPPSTPEHFWEVQFPSTQECLERGIQKETQAVPLRSRRRRPRHTEQSNADCDSLI